MSPTTHPAQKTGQATHEKLSLRQCRICLDTDSDLLAKLPQLTKLDPELASAAVMAMDDLCVSCCLDLGRQSWTYIKQGHPDANIAAAYAAERLCGKQRPS